LGKFVKDVLDAAHATLDANALRNIP